MYSIKPQGLNFSVRVFCDMTSKNGVGVTEIGHDSESRTLVRGCELPGCYNRTIKYKISMEQIVAIINQSKNCEQFIKYECFASRLLEFPDVWWVSRRGYQSKRFIGGFGWWVSRQGSKMNYWGGAAVDSGNCSCGMNNSCAGGGNCNCNMNDYAWREDSGYLTDKNTLPVTELRFGDADGHESSNGERESGFHTLGKLRCWG
ncbi:neurexin-4-like [Dendronephthya gigantea]|uniref:neurexin-4-like n=1 Tax=Dendronephthya gigantea TaxID=151771 RepID=UPI00106A501F|nr:neurexin-4-like [Dendronephthya gigantea]